MKTIIAGSRSITDYVTVEKAIASAPWPVTEVVSGCARGVDRLGETFANLHKLSIKRFPADWDQYGRVAGAIRNVEMAEYAEALIAVWDGQSKGTANMIAVAKKRGLKVHVVEVG